MDTFIPIINTRPARIETHPAYLDYGFRLFFLGAAVWALVDMTLWTAFYSFHWAGVFSHAITSPMSWHAFEMTYGYGMAVVAGFLLTAVMNWTGRPTLTGKPLIALFIAWALARLLPLLGGESAFIAGRVMDQVFLLALAFATLKPCIQTRKHRNTLLIGFHLLLIITGNLLYGLGVTDVLPGFDYIGLYLGLYILILLVLFMGRRVISSFIESAAGGKVTLHNWVWIDRGILILFVAYIFCEMISRPLGAVAALLIALGLIIRLAGWYTHFIWQRPLLWVLFVAYSWLPIGFALRALSAWVPLLPYLTIHAFSVGCIGMITIGMMARVALGHSGRSVHTPPRSVNLMFILIALSAVLRVFFPMALPGQYLWWITGSQVSWIAGFLLFIVVYAPILTTHRSQS